MDQAFIGEITYYPQKSLARYQPSPNPTWTQSLDSRPHNFGPWLCLASTHSQGCCPALAFFFKQVWPHHTRQVWVLPFFAEPRMGGPRAGSSRYRYRYRRQGASSALARYTLSNFLGVHRRYRRATHRPVCIGVYVALHIGQALTSGTSKALALDCARELWHLQCQRITLPGG